MALILSAAAAAAFLSLFLLLGGRSLASIPMSNAILEETLRGSTAAERGSGNGAASAAASRLMFSRSPNPLNLDNGIESSFAAVGMRVDFH